MTIAQHLGMSNEHFTPEWIIDLAHETMGAIDYDPASCMRANRSVRAKEFCGLPLDGLTQDVPRGARRMFCNPPGGKRGGESSMALFWDMCARWQSWKLGRELVFVGFKLDLLQLAQRYDCQQPGNGIILVPRKRIAYSGEKAPPHCGCVVYLGRRTDCFHHLASAHGIVLESL